MEAENLEIICLELKYCEYCGSLWLRAHSDENVYCETCQDVLAVLPFPDAKISNPRVPVYKDRPDKDRKSDFVVCGKGGNA